MTIHLSKIRFTARRKHTVPTRMDAAAQARLASLMPAAYLHHGLPVTPTLPITPEDAYRIQTKHLLPRHRVVRVQPMDPLDDETKSLEKRIARRKKLALYRKQGASGDSQFNATA